MIFLRWFFRLFCFVFRVWSSDLSQNKKAWRCSRRTKIFANKMIVRLPCKLKCKIFSEPKWRTSPSYKRGSSLFGLQPDCIPYFLKICRIKVIKLTLFVEPKISINISFTYIFDYYAEYLKWILDSSFDLSNGGYNFRCLTLECSECRKLWDWYITISLIFWLFAQTLIIRPFSIL